MHLPVLQPLSSLASAPVRWPDLGVPAPSAALIYKLKQHAMKKCRAEAAAYAECADGRTFSVVWACRQHLNDLNGCLKQWCGPYSLPLRLWCDVAAPGRGRECDRGAGALPLL